MRRSILNAAALVALFVAAFVASQRLAGTSPIVWMDTFRDEREVRQCLLEDSCTLVGLQTSIPGQFHGVAWLDLRTLLAWLGVGLDGAHLMIQILNALAVVLVFHLARQLGGALAGAAAAWIFLDGVEPLLQVAALYNCSLLLFLGTVFVLACTAVVERPGIASVALAALVGAVMANVHLACVLTGASVVWVALTAPRRRFMLAGFGAVLFGLATVAIAPPTWLHNLTGLLGDRAAADGSAAALPLPRNIMMAWALFGLYAWAASLASRAPTWVEYRRRSLGALAVLVPFLLGFLVAPSFGVAADVRYLLHVKAACAIAAAVPLALVASAALRRLSSRFLLRPVEWIAPFAVALLMAFSGRLAVGWGPPPENDARARLPTVADLAAVSRILHDEEGWDAAQMAEHLKTPYGVALLSGIRQTTVGDDGAGGSAGAFDRGALLMVIDRGDLPEPLPTNWKVVRRAPRFVMVLILMRSRIDWRELAICARAAAEARPNCEKSGWRFDQEAPIAVPGMPPSGTAWRGTLELSLPLRPDASGDDAVFMPRLPSVCGGRITAVPAGGPAIDPDGRHVVLPASGPDAASPSAIKLEWQVGSAECDALSYDSLPPFFIEGDAATVQRIEAILRKREG